VNNPNLNIDHISYLGKLSVGDDIKKLCEETDIIFREMKSRRIAFKRVKKISKIWSC
jgi:hypothetical protein